MKNDVHFLQGVLFWFTIWVDSAHMQYVIPHPGHIKFKSKRYNLKKKKKMKKKKM